ncbi:MAG: nucleotidyltransferase family protein [Opitutaceae bacterium]
MKAMILAAGLGARLRPLTDSRPKALVEIAGEPLLAIVLKRLAAAGVTEVVINLHHFGDQVEAWIERRGAFGLRVAFSRESALLDTGGALKHAAWFFKGDDQPFLLHNVDVLSDIDLAAMMRAHRDSGVLATLACQPRATTRSLLFDAGGALCGRRTASGDMLARPPVGEVVALGFCGIHAIDPRLLEQLPENAGAFSIVDTYLHLNATCPESHPPPVRAFRADHARWRDAGRPENLRPLDA